LHIVSVVAVIISVALVIYIVVLAFKTHKLIRDDKRKDAEHARRMSLISRVERGAPPLDMERFFSDLKDCF
jgi:hypothetical protein